MASYSYTAIDKTGKTVTGIREGDNARQIRNALREMDLVPIDVIESNKKMKTSQEKLSFFSRPSNFPTLL